MSQLCGVCVEEGVVDVGAGVAVCARGLIVGVVVLGFVGVPMCPVKTERSALEC